MFDLLSQATQPSPQDVRAIFHSVWDSLRMTYEATSWYGWLALLGGILIGTIAGHLVRTLLTTLAEKWEGRRREIRAAILDAIATPGSLFLITLGTGFGLAWVSLQGSVRTFVAKVLSLLVIFSVAWLLYRLVDAFALWLGRLARRTQSNLDDQMVPIARRALRLFIVIVFTLFTADAVFNRDISAWLAGLGIAGLAVSLAAQDTLRNFFGTLTILFDRPFQLGDRIFVDGVEGIVEDIGFRSTRIRVVDGGPLVSVPNMTVAAQSVRNFTRRRSIHRNLTLKLKPGTPPDKVLRAVEITREIFADPEMTAPLAKGTEPRIGLEDIVGPSATIKVHYAFGSKDQTAYLKHAERINLTILHRFATEGLELA